MLVLSLCDPLQKFWHEMCYDHRAGTKERQKSLCLGCRYLTTVFLKQQDPTSLCSLLDCGRGPTPKTDYSLRDCYSFHLLCNLSKIKFFNFIPASQVSFFFPCKINFNVFLAFWRLLFLFLKLTSKWSVWQHHFVITVELSLLFFLLSDQGLCGQSL